MQVLKPTWGNQGGTEKMFAKWLKDVDGLGKQPFKLVLPTVSETEYNGHLLTRERIVEALFDSLEDQSERSEWKLMVSEASGNFQVPEPHELVGESKILLLFDYADATPRHYAAIQKQIKNTRSLQVKIRNLKKNLKADENHIRFKTMFVMDKVTDQDLACGDFSWEIFL